jgi:hypothetical protein
MILTNPFTGQTINSNPEGCNQYKKCFKVDSTKTVREGSVSRYEGTVGEGQVGYRAMSGKEYNQIVERPKRNLSTWYSEGRFTADVEKPKGYLGRKATTMFTGDPTELVGETARRHKWDMLIEADLSGLPYSSIADLDTEGLHADLGRGLGIVGEIPINRIRSAKRLHYRTGLPIED